MDNFLKYLENVKNSMKNGIFENVHIVIGNESCDLDSCISSLALAYFLNTHKIPEISESALIVPIQNVSYEHFLLRTDNCFVLQENGVPLESLLYRKDVNLEELLRTKRVTTSLVDHHVLSKNDEILQSTVVQIFDHRPVDLNSKWKESVRIRIEEIGSCSTLIADEILSADENYMFKELAHLVYETIIYDTIALLPENGKAKELDLAVAGKLETLFHFDLDRKSVYQKLWKAHNDVSSLSPKQMLFKDLKMVENIPVPGLPMLVEDFLKLQGSYAAIGSFAAEYNTSLVVLIGLDAKEEVRRDVAIYYKCAGEKLKCVVLEKLRNSAKLKGYDFMFQEKSTAFNNVICLRQQNIKLSRKQIVPLLIDAICQ